ncbi:hypothetical protein [Variovorax sp. HJSM1_2]|uniref:hypothetical protein n=1 Tax=Variovorax sp. HJSM1_2 TaxID=3366263 RepID=UPI003BF4A302
MEHEQGEQDDAYQGAKIENSEPFGDREVLQALKHGTVSGGNCREATCAFGMHAILFENSS